ncbi:amidohydrolase [Streptomyces avidinii]
MSDVSDVRVGDVGGASDVLHVKGRVLVGPDEVRDELWVVGGRISYERPRGAREPPR